MQPKATAHRLPEAERGTSGAIGSPVQRLVVPLLMGLRLLTKIGYKASYPLYLLIIHNLQEEFSKIKDHP